MFRGNPPYGRLHPLTDTYQKALLLPREIDVQIEKIQVSSLPADHPLPEEAILRMSLETKSGKDAKILKKGCVLKQTSSNGDQNGEPFEITADKPGDPLVKFSVIQDDFPKLKVKLDKAKKKTAFPGFSKSRNSLATSVSPIDLYGLLPKNRADLSTEPTDICLSHELLTNGKNSQQPPDSGENHRADKVETTLTLEMSNERFGKPKDTSFQIMLGAFYDCIIPEDIESLWGPIPLQKLPPGIDNKCRAVTHGIAKDGGRPMSAYIIHSIPLQQSAVQMFIGDQMAVVAHLIGLEQVGYEKVLGMTMGVMRNDHTWRGMIIKDNEGDWGACVAAWRGMKKGKPGVPGTAAFKTTKMRLITPFFRHQGHQSKARSQRQSRSLCNEVRQSKTSQPQTQLC